MKTIYLVEFTNGESYELKETYSYKAYSSKETAEKAIEELKKNEDFLRGINEDPENWGKIRFYITPFELVEE